MPLDFSNIIDRSNLSERIDMSDDFNLERLSGRRQFPGGPDTDPGIRLREGYLPGFSFGGGMLEYLHADGIDEDGQIVPSDVDAVGALTGKVMAPGDIFIVDTSVEPPLVIKKVGSFVMQEEVIVYEPSSPF